MKVLHSLVPAIIGVLVVLQAGLNRRISAHWGLPSAVLLNACLAAAFAALFLGYCALRPETIPPLLRANASLRAFSPWFVLPGFIGFCLILGGPWAIARFGATHTFVLVVSAQLAAGALWDALVEGLPVTKERVLGITLAWAGALVTSGFLTRGR